MGTLFCGKEIQPEEALPSNRRFSDGKVGEQMADKELRKMNRVEMIEIIYALQQNQRALREENEDLRRQLEDRRLRMGSMRALSRKRPSA